VLDERDLRSSVARSHFAEQRCSGPTTVVGPHPQHCAQQLDSIHRCKELLGNLASELLRQRCELHGGINDLVVKDRLCSCFQRLVVCCSDKGKPLRKTGRQVGQDAAYLERW
jgi:hypothetical protein